MVEVTILIAFLAGLVSFLSPCILPLIPAYLSYLGGVSSADFKKNPAKARSQIIINTIIFIIGFSLVFSLLGILLNTLLLGFTSLLGLWMRRIGGAIIIIFGLYLVKLLGIPFLDKEYHFVKARKFRYSYLTSFLFGVSFAAGWSPCVGAILASIITLAATSAKTAFGLLVIYSIGLSLPFLLSAVFFAQLQTFINKHIKTIEYVRIIFGLILIILGILVFTNKLTYIAGIPLLNSIFNN